MVLFIPLQPTPLNKGAVGLAHGTQILARFQITLWMDDMEITVGVSR